MLEILIVTITIVQTHPHPLLTFRWRSLSAQADASRWQRLRFALTVRESCNVSEMIVFPGCRGVGQVRTIVDFRLGLIA